MAWYRKNSFLTSIGTENHRSLYWRKYHVHYLVNDSCHRQRLLLLRFLFESAQSPTWGLMGRGNYFCFFIDERYTVEHVGHILFLSNWWTPRSCCKVATTVDLSVKWISYIANVPTPFLHMTWLQVGAHGTPSCKRTCDMEYPMSFASSHGNGTAARG